PLSPRDWLAPGGAVVLDDFTPRTGWPPLLDGAPDRPRLHWLEHPDLCTTEVVTGPASATLVGILR
ncbi:MAG: SAM-dependent methyltransferase, partial [Acidimicrobiia bacterium]|nr:SAM-dependent methyltransferase [Acidimicrobiia bacterium]